MLTYFKAVWANDNEEHYNYLIKWFSNMVKKNKNSTCLIVRGDQGIGKSTFIDFFRDWVLGIKSTCKGKTDHLKGQHNMQLLGKLLVYFEELQFLNDKEWNAVDSELKDFISSEVASYTDKYEKRFDAENINNYVILCNKSCVKGIGGRRYFVLDMNTKYRNDFEYFKSIRNACFNDDVGAAFYSYLMEVETENFLSLNMPMTKNKRLAILNTMTPVEKFLKLFVKRNTGIRKMKTFDLYHLYLRTTHERTSKCNFYSEMDYLGLKQAKLNGYMYYKFSYEELKKLSDSKHWIDPDDDDQDDYEFVEDDEEKSMFEKEDTDSKRVVVSVETHKEIIDDIKAKLSLLEEQTIDATEDLKECDKYIKELENRIRLLEKNNNKLESKNKQLESKIEQSESELELESEVESEVEEKNMNDYPDIPTVNFEADIKPNYDKSFVKIDKLKYKFAHINHNVDVGYIENENGEKIDISTLF
jgi:hypothetical protein